MNNKLPGTGPIWPPLEFRNTHNETIASMMRWFAAFALTFLLTGCLIESLTPTATVTLTKVPTAALPLASLLPTPAETPTIQLLATHTATVWNPIPPEAEKILFHDSLDSNKEGWPLINSSNGAVMFTEDALTFTVRTPYTPLVSIMPRNLPSDLFVEVTVRTSLCGEGVDTFGIVFRYTRDGSYRYAITCSGKIRLERYQGLLMEGRSVWKEAPGLLQGAPAENRIGVLIQDGDFRFFVNGLAVIDLHEPTIHSGKLGLFAQTENSKLLMVVYKNFTIYSLTSP